MKLKGIFTIILSIILCTACSTNDEEPVVDVVIDNGDGDTDTGGSDDQGDSSNSLATIVKLNAFTNLPLKSIHFADENTGFIAASKNDETTTISEIYKTTDGGITWNKVFSDNFYIENIKVLTPNLIAAVALTGEILISKDAGTSWEVHTIFTNRGVVLKDVTYDKHDEIYVIGYHEATKKGVVYLTWNEGELWNEYTGNDEFKEMMQNNMLSSVDYIKETGYMIIGGGLNNKGILVTQFESKFEILETNQPIRYLDVAAKSGTVMAVGNNGIVNSASELGGIYGVYSQHNWTTFDYNDNNRLTAVALGTGTSGNIIAVGRNKSNNLTNGEFITLSKDNGNNWERINHQFPTAAWNDIHALNEDTFIVIGNNGLLILLTVK
ncbi:WD40/YVTN/BNR-like repeat-containing protein [Tenacibaculum amylolyticum]|uniref:WD40/YVTN/BNR-like repeat-containing protein n=1 Tax=Tenacibaculum amylolyticum TaxID=104269 RepID=UPI00389382B2